MNDGFDPKFALKKSVPLKYLAFNTFATIELGFCMILYLSFATSAWLKQLKSLNPSPPLHFA